jgi:hypothetical protein
VPGCVGARAGDIESHTDESADAEANSDTNADAGTNAVTNSDTNADTNAVTNSDANPAPHAHATTGRRSDLQLGRYRQSAVLHCDLVPRFQWVRN